jgi:hypothetical protein
VSKKGWPKTMRVIYDKSGANHPLDQKIVAHTTHLNNPIVTADFFKRNRQINEYSVQVMKINHEKLTPDEIVMFFKWVERTIKEVEQRDQQKNLHRT